MEGASLGTVVCLIRGAAHSGVQHKARIRDEKGGFVVRGDETASDHITRPQRRRQTRRERAGGRRRRSARRGGKEAAREEMSRHRRTCSRREATMRRLDRGGAHRRSGDRALLDTRSSSTAPFNAQKLGEANLGRLIFRRGGAFNRRPCTEQQSWARSR